MSQTPQAAQTPQVQWINGVRAYGEGDPVAVRIEDGVIAEIRPEWTAAEAESLAAESGSTVVIDGRSADGSPGVLLPGFVDLHTHLREPGREDTETIETGSAAAARGGYTAVFAMANTDPVADSAVVCEYVARRGREVGLVDVHPVGAISVGLKGEKLAELGAMAAAGVKMFSDDGYCVNDPQLMRRALDYAAGLGVLIAQHAEDSRMTVGSIAHDGPNAARLGLAGWPRAAEESIVARDALLVRDANLALEGAAATDPAFRARVHVCHASTAGTAELVSWAKAQGIAITAEVTPHHLILDDSRLETFDAVNKVNPPLRESSDVATLRRALVDGTIDCVATDHAPHASQEKCCEFAVARPGMLGLETALAIIGTTLIDSAEYEFGWRDVARVMSERPAEIVGLDDQGRPLEVGEPANLTVIDPALRWTVQADDLASKSENTPFAAMDFVSKPILTVLRGRVTADHGEVASPLQERGHAWI